MVRLEVDRTTTRHSGTKAWCEAAEEHKHWVHTHPEVAGRKEDSAAFQKCNQDHVVEMNGTPAQFHVAFDRCMREAYGLPAPKQ